MVYAMYDANRDGYLNLAEFTRSWDDMDENASAAQMNAIFDIIDSNNDSKISKSECYAYFAMF